MLAVESGSRAWGFASPDSDFDVRFIYVRQLDDYLGLTPPRDVIETPEIGLLDLSGWDLRKALSLGLSWNPALVEWLVAYRLSRKRLGSGGAPETLPAAYES